MNRKTLAAALTILGAGLLIYVAYVLHPLAGLALAGACLVGTGMYGIDVE